MKRVISTIICAFLMINAAKAADGTQPLPPAGDSAPSSIVLSPSTLRVQVLKGSLTLDEEEKRIEDAKNNVGLARAGLFPSINVSAMLSGNFILTGIDFLVPFLIPGNWADLYQEKHLFAAEKLSYKALALNTYSSALALYFNVRSDSEVAEQYKQQAQDLRKIAGYIQELSEMGIASPADVKNALGNAEAAEGQASKMQVSMVKEIASLRQALGLSLQTQILFSDSASDGTAPASDVEASVTPSDIEKVVDQALSIAPEQAQIYELVQAGQDGTWSKAFGWINSASISSSGTSGSSASLFNLHPKGSITLGLGIYPAIELSNRNVEEIRQRLIELKQENTQILEGSILAVNEAQKEFAHFATAESNLQDVYNDTLQRYQMGIASLYDVLIAHKALTSAAINRIQAQLDVTLLRVTLHRTMLTDQFAQIRGCDSANLPKQEKRGGLAGWFDGIFGGNHDDNGVSLMQLCKQTD